MSERPPEFGAEGPLEEEDRSRVRLLPVFPLPNVVFFPQQTLPLYIFEQRYRSMVKDALEGDRLLAVALIKPGWENRGVEPEPYEVCGAGEIIQATHLMGGNMNILLRGLARVRILRTVKESPYLVAEVSVLAEPADDSPETVRLAELARSIFFRAQEMKPGRDPDSHLALKLLASPMDIFNYLCAHYDLEVPQKQELLEMDGMVERLRLLAIILGREMAILN